MDYPITVPGVGLNAGKFTNGNPVASLAASLDPAEWANAVTDEILNVIIQGGLTPTENTNTQLATAIKNMIRGGDYKDSVRFTTTANIVLSGLGTQAGGDWPAALTAADRILVKNNTLPAENGLYTAAAGAWARATDADTGAEINSGAIIPVESGTLSADTNWQLTTDGAITIGTTALTFIIMTSQFASSAEAQGLSLLIKALSPGGLNAAFQGANQSLAANGYQKLPGGLILQWGSQAVTTTQTNYNFPIAFPTAALKIVLADGDAVAATQTFGAHVVSATQYSAICSGASVLASYIAIGH